MGGAKRGMTGKGHLERGGKNPYSSCCLGGGKHKGCFRQIKLQGDSLHVFRTEALRVLKYTQRVAAKRGFSENIDEAILILRHY